MPNKDNWLKRLFRADAGFYKTTLTLAVPVILQNMITIGVNIMDTMMLGTYGEIQLSASSLANEFINIYHILCMGMGGGAAVLTAQYWGRQDMPRLKKTVTIMLWLAMFLAACFTAVTLICPDKLMAMYTPDPAIIEKGVLYFRMSAPAYIMMGISLTLTIVMRSTRQVKLPLITSIVAFFVNIFFNWVFIYGRLGAPEMQIEGAALGTVIARAAEMVIIGGYFIFFDKKVHYRVKDLLDLSWEQAKLFFKYGAPVVVSDSLLAVGNSMMAVIMGHIGASYVAANAIVAPTVRLSTVFNQGLCNAAGIMTGNTLGRGEKEKAYRQGVTYTALSVVVGVVAAGIIMALCPLLIENYNITEETAAIAYQIMFSVAVMVIFQTVQGMLTKGVLRSGGDTKFLMLADVLFLWLASIPLGYLTGIALKWPAFWVCCALKIDWAIKSIWCVFRLKSKKWIRVV